MENTTPPTAPTPGRLLRLDAVEHLTGLRKSSVYTYMASREHGFPTPVRIGARAVAWKESEVLEWIATRNKKPPAGAADATHHDTRANVRPLQAPRLISSKKDQ